MKKIWIVAPFASIELIGNRNRFQYLAHRLHYDNEEVIFFTSNFSHLGKKHIDNNILSEYPFTLKLINELGYKKNVSIKRAISHIKFSLNLKKEIKNMEKPDVIYVAYPTMSASYIAGKYAKKNSIPFVIDIQDTWPESISAAIDTDKALIKIIMSPIKFFANKIYKMADFVFGVSETYAQRANVKGTKCKEFIPVYIGAELDKFDNCYSELNKIYKSANEIWITYIGTLSHSYDIDTAIKAFAELKEYKHIKLLILGTGPDEEQLVQLAKDLNVYNDNVIFYGFINYEKMVAILKKSDIALNAINEKAKQTITNKLGDYLAAGLPILNSCQEKEVLELILNRNVGLNYIPKNVESLKKTIINMTSNKKEMSEISINSRELAENLFNREESYKIIINKIKDL